MLSFPLFILTSLKRCLCLHLFSFFILMSMTPIQHRRTTQTHLQESRLSNFLCHSFLSYSSDLLRLTPSRLIHGDISQIWLVKMCLTLREKRALQQIEEGNTVSRTWPLTTLLTSSSSNSSSPMTLAMYRFIKNVHQTPNKIIFFILLIYYIHT